jgi:hypothetical protein
VLNRSDGQPFCTGRSIYLDHLGAGAEPTAKIFVKVQPAGLDVVVLAQLDTGSAYTVLDPDIAAGAGVATDSGEAITLSTRGGSVPGHLVTHAVTLLADDGDSLEIDGLVFVPSGDWPFAGRSFLGYSGFLERIRVAIDPQVNHFYFGNAA